MDNPSSSWPGKQKIGQNTRPSVKDTVFDMFRLYFQHYVFNCQVYDHLDPNPLQCIESLVCLSLDMSNFWPKMTDKQNAHT